MKKFCIDKIDGNYVVATETFEDFYITEDNLSGFLPQRNKLYGNGSTSIKSDSIVVYKSNNSNLSNSENSTVSEFAQQLTDFTMNHPIFLDISENGHSGVFSYEVNRYLAKDIDFIDKGFIDLSEEDISPNNKFIFIGGDHSITYKIIENYINVVDNKEDIIVLHFDAHHDFGLRRQFTDDLNHNNFIYYLTKLKNISSIYQFGQQGLRSIEQMFFDEKVITIPQNNNQDILNEMSSRIKNKKIYITFDMDVLNPNLFDNVDYLKAGGLRIEQVLKYIKDLDIKSQNIIGIDMVEGNTEGSLYKYEYASRILLQFIELIGGHYD